MATPEQHGRHLNAIVDLFSAGQHQWTIDDPDAVLTSAWVAQSPAWYLLPELAEKTCRAAIDEVSSSKPKGRLVVVSSDPSSGADLCPSDVFARLLPVHARAVLSKPVYLVLENATADWHFLKAMARTFNNEPLLEAIVNAWIVPDHAGGTGEFLKRIDALLDLGAVPWRIASLRDSDRLAPGPLAPAVTTQIEKIRARGATSLVLFKREVENYLPDTALEGKRTRRQRVSFLALTRIQRDHFDMKSGFKYDLKSQGVLLSGEHGALFAKTNPWHVRRLIGGFGGNVGDRFGDMTFAQSEMVAVCETCPGEIDVILQTLVEML